jgi:hypothetical protein
LPAADVALTLRRSAMPLHPKLSNRANWEGAMAASEEMKIVLQVGTELRVNNKGEVVVSNPELELAREERAADAVLLYRFDPNRGEHVFRLVDPVADHKHMKVHRAND